MSSYLHVLIVEDSEDDTLLVLRELRQNGYTLTYVRVDTPNAMQAALDQQSWDIVIADYSLPAFSAPEALKLLQSRNLDLPFIIVSGTIGEEIAVAAMKAGAHDYLIKGNLTRLVPAVERELREALERQKRYIAEQALQEAAQRIYEQAALLDISTDAISVRDLNNHILFWNKGAERLYGWEAVEVLGSDAVELLNKLEDTLPQLKEIQTKLAQDGKWQGELQQVTKDGKDIMVESRWTLVRDEIGHPKSILTVSTDITEKKQLEAQILRTQRLESLGTLASGIAHDFNNILTPILAVAQLLPLKFPNLDENSQQLLTILETSAKQGADLVKQILSFTRGVGGSRTIVQVRHLLSDIAQVSRRTFPKFIETRTDIVPDLWTVFADPTQLHQVLMNLIVNARDAMPNGGVLTIKAENLWIDENYTRIHVDAEVGPYIVIAITDTGTGIPSEIMNRIFDPFFTTKEVGKGTGLGLSTTMGIIKNHNGFLTVYSQMGKGSCFKVYLPCREVTEANEVADDTLPSGNGELILVVDDEVSICEITKTTLENHNYRVFTASDGIEALVVYAEQKDNISAILIDLIMPGMDGSTTILTLQRMNPQVKIIAMSGLMNNGATSQDRSTKIQRFLSKPFTAQALLSTLQEVLHS